MLKKIGTKKQTVKKDHINVNKKKEKKQKVIERERKVAVK